MTNSIRFRLLSLFAIFAALNSGRALAIDLSLFEPLPQPTVIETDSDRALVDLGRRLFLDKRLSMAGDISCNSCHGLDSYGVDGEPTSPGHLGKRGDRNSPSVFNAALHMSQFWDGRAKDVEEQALGPVMNPVEMAMPTEAEVMKRLSGDRDYKKLFVRAFPQQQSPMTFENVGKAIGAFERQLLTPSRFDDYLRGSKNVLTSEELAGLDLFVNQGCVACHNGVGLGGGMYQKLGLVKPYETPDLGRYNVTKEEADKFVFKVPSLRNITETGPYFHDGKVASIDEAVSLMARHQLGKELTPEQIELIVTFLESLKGQIPPAAKVSTDG